MGFPALVSAKGGIPTIRSRIVVHITQTGDA